MPLSLAAADLIYSTAVSELGCNASDVPVMASVKIVDSLLPSIGASLGAGFVALVAGAPPSHQQLETLEDPTCEL
jgi:hypothetical protein